jgi:hypothetical protein
MGSKGRASAGEEGARGGEEGARHRGAEEEVEAVRASDVVARGGA